MEKLHTPVRGWWRDIAGILAALGIHVWYLCHTTFVDWPEMLLYPWFLTKGLLYYRDVVLAYVPGSYYLLHALYSLIGYSVASERIIAYGFILLTDVLIYITARRLTKSFWYSIAALVFFVWWQPIFSGNTIWYETILTPMYLGMYLFALRYLEKSMVRYLVPVGIMLALTTLIKQTAIWSVLFVCLFVWLSSKKKIEGFFHAVIIGFMTIAANLLVWGYFALLGAGSAYGFWVFGFLFDLSQGGSGYALMPPRSDITLILPAIIPLLLYGLFRVKKHEWLLILLTVAVLLSGLPRWGLHRLQPMLAYIAVSVGVLMHYVVVSKIRWIRLVGCVAACVVLMGSWRSIRVFITLRDAMQPQFFGGTYHALLSYIQKEAPGPIYVLGNYDYLYFGKDEKPTVLPWVPLFPWNGQVPGMQKQLIDSLESHQVPYILFVPFHPDTGYYLDYSPDELFLYVRAKYAKIGAAPVSGGELLKRR